MQREKAIPPDCQVDEQPLPWPSPHVASGNLTRPYYRWLEKIILSFIESKIWPSGRRIPNEMDIAQATGLNIHTVKKALLALVEKGYLVRIKKRGTFVAGFADNASRYRFYALSGSFSTEQRMPHSKREVLETLLVYDDCPMKKYDMGPRQCRLRRRFFIDGVRSIYTTSWIPADMCPGLENVSHSRLSHGPLYQILDDDYGVVMREGTELISAMSADIHIADLLGLPEGAPILFIRMISYTDNDVICEYRESYINTSYYSMQRNW